VCVCVCVSIFVFCIQALYQVGALLIFLFFYQSVDCLFIFLTCLLKGRHFKFDEVQSVKSSLMVHVFGAKKSFLNQRSQIFFPMLSSSSFLHSGQRSISSNLYAICGKG